MCALSIRPNSHANARTPACQQPHGQTFLWVLELLGKKLQFPLVEDRFEFVQTLGGEVTPVSMCETVESVTGYQGPPPVTAGDLVTMASIHYVTLRPSAPARPL